MSTIASSLHTATPGLIAIDPRGLAVRDVAYCRKITGEPAHQRVTHHLYNAAGQLIANCDPRLARWMQTGFDTKANLITIYSLSDEALMTDSVDAGWRLVVANETNHVCLSWNARGSHTSTLYDALLRPVSISEQGTGREKKTVERFTYGDGSPESAQRNGCGRVVRHDDTAGNRQITDYALHGEPMGEVRRFLKHLQIPSWPVELPLRDELLNPENFTTTSRFAPTGELLRLIDAMGNRQRHQYDIAGQPMQTHLQLAGHPEQAVVSNIDYDAWGRPVSDTAGNGVVSTAQYRPEDGRLVRFLSQRAMNSPLQDLRYEYDPVGNVVRIEETVLTTRHFNNQRTEPVSTYGYDSLYQLIHATGRESCSATNGPELPHHLPLPPDPTQLANYVQTYDYDDGGNLKTLRHVGARQYCRQMITAPDSNRSLPLPDTGPDPDFTDSFDASGNLKRLHPGPDLDWNLRDQLQEITLIPRPEGGSDREWYVYDGGGQRVRKVKTTQAKNLGHVAEVLYLPGLEIRTNTARNEILHVINVSIGRGNVRVLHWETPPPGGVANDQLRYGLSDLLGSHTVELDEQAQILNRESYYPYGGTAWFAARSEAEGNYKTVRYSGKERDSSGLYYYGFRYYVSWWFRWLSPDPAGAVDGLNPYQMVGNNPSSYFDPSGLMKTQPDAPEIPDRPLSTLRSPAPPVPDRPMPGSSRTLISSPSPRSAAAPVSKNHEVPPDIAPPYEPISVGYKPLKLVKMRDISSSFETWLTKHTERDWLVLKDYSSMEALDARGLAQQRVGASNEVFAFRFSEQLNLNIVPATVLQPGNDRHVLSRYIHSGAGRVTFDRQTSSMYIFDYLLNTRDRTDLFGNIVFDQTGKSFAIDHDQILEPGFSAIDPAHITDAHLSYFTDDPSTLSRIMETDWAAFFDTHAFQDPLINRAQAKAEFLGRISFVRQRLSPM